MTTILTRDERELLAAVNRHRRADGWIIGYGYRDPRPRGGEATNPGGVAVDWLFSWKIDGETGRSLRVRLLNPQGFTERITLEADVDSVTEAVDVLVAYGLLPQGLSSAYRAGLEAGRPEDVTRGGGEVAGSVGRSEPATAPDRAWSPS